MNDPDPNVVGAQMQALDDGEQELRRLLDQGQSNIQHFMNQNNVNNPMASFTPEEQRIIQGSPPP